MMQNKTNSFKKQIRSRDIEKVKKIKRAEFQSFNSSQNPQRIKIYWECLHSTTLDNLLQQSQVSSQMVAGRFQMLTQIIFSDDCDIFTIKYLDVLIQIIKYIDFCMKNCEEEFYQLMKKTMNMNDFSQNIENLKIAYTITKFCHYIPINTILPIIGGIYFLISASTQQINEKVILLLQNLLKYCFKDTYTLKKELMQLNDSSPRSHIEVGYIFTVLLNLSASENEDVIAQFVQMNVFEDLIYYMEQYGFKQEYLVQISEIYSNCIEFLCTNLQKMTRSRRQTQISNEQQYYLSTESLCLHFLYLPIYFFLLEQQNSDILVNMVTSSCHLLKISQSQNFEKKSKFEIIQNIESFLINGILMENVLIKGQQDLYISICYYWNDFSLKIKMVELFQHINKKYITSYYSQAENLSFPKKQKGPCKTLKKIKWMIEATRVLLIKMKQKEEQSGIMESFVKIIMEIWCKQELPHCQCQFLDFLRQCIEIPSLFEYIFFEMFQEQILQILKCNYNEVEQIRIFLDTINLVLQNVGNYQKVEQYFMKHKHQFLLIDQSIQGYIAFDQDQLIVQKALKASSKMEILMKSFNIEENNFL